MVDVADMAAIRAKASLLDAIKLCINASGLPAATVYERLGFDRGHWKRMMDGSAHFPPSLVPQLMELCGNQIPLLWLVDHCGYDVSSLRPAETVLQRQLREAEQRLARMEAERQAERQMLQDVLTRGRAA